MNIFASAKELEAAKAESLKLREQIGALETRALTAEDALKDLNAQVGTLTAERDSALAAIKDQSDKVIDLSSKLAAKDSEISTVKAGVEKQVAAQAAATVASLGHEAVKLTALPAKPASNLTGLDRAIAAHKSKNN